MLIRIVDHFHLNPKRVDKLIAVKGLPEEWIFRKTDEGLELKKPWEPDIDKNIPFDIRHLCEPTYIIRKYQPLNAGEKGYVEKLQILGIRIDYNSEPGRQMWEDVERFIEESTPRNERVPVPVLCARDERSGFDTYTPRKNSRGSLELVPSPVPLVDLTKYQVVKVEAPVLMPTPMEPKAETAQQHEFKCDECDYHHYSQRGIRMHAVKRHPKKEKVGV